MKYKLTVLRMCRYTAFLSMFLFGFVIIHFGALYWVDISSLFQAIVSDIQQNYQKYLIALVAFSIGISLLVSAHEFGHMWVAKQFNIFVIEYSVGIGPLLWSTVYNETQYSLRSVPLGGYVKLAGHYGQCTRGDGRDFDEQSHLKRFLVMSAGVIVNFIVAFILFTGLYYSGTDNPYMTKSGTTIGRILPGSYEDVSGLKVGDVILSVNDVSVSTWSEVTLQYILAEDNIPYCSHLPVL